MRIPHESEEQMAFVQWLTFKGLDFFAVKNEQTMSKKSPQMAAIQEAKSKRMGKKTGVQDLVIFTDSQIIFIEMKRKKGGKVTIEQDKWSGIVNKYPYSKAHICYGCTDAISVVEKYLGERK